MCGTLVLKCVCKNKFQDAQYGDGWRVHNTNNELNWWDRKATCTVCGDIKLSGDTLKTKEWLTEHSEWNTHD